LVEQGLGFIVNTHVKKHTTWLFKKTKLSKQGGNEHETT
jgi:hypothetical protein